MEEVCTLRRGKETNTPQVIVAMQAWHAWSERVLTAARSLRETEMSFALTDLSGLVANQGAECAKKELEIVIRTARAIGKAISKKQADKAFTRLSFLTWAYANGVWSNLENTALRRDLMATSFLSIALRTSYELSEDKSKEAVRAHATRVDEELKLLSRVYIERTTQYAKKGVEASPNTARVVVYEWIQEIIGFSDTEMLLIVPQLGDSYPEKIEEIAIQVNKAANERPRGFLSRLFGS